MKISQNVLETIGNTPIVRLNKIAEKCSANLHGKLEFFNPGGSIKDRLGRWLIEDAEKRGVLKPGGTIVEGTSGNTGFGLAITSVIKGYQCIFVLPDKMSDEKIKSLRAFGAKVIVTPTAVAPDDPRSYYSVSRRLTEETPNSLYMDQYNNLANRECHYQQTGPEILEQMPEIDVFIAGIGTGGTICGVGKYLKEKKPSVEVVAVDPVGSIVYDFFKTGKMVPAKTYVTEGIGEDFIPKNYDFDVIDDMIQVDDRESHLMTRELLVKDGIYAGVSSGAAVAGAMKWIEAQGDRLKGKNVLTIICDSGSRYLSKVYDDDWMRENGFYHYVSLGTVRDLVQSGPTNKIHMAKQKDKVSDVIDLMNEKGISQLPVQDVNGWIKGIVTERSLLNRIYSGKLKTSDLVMDAVDAKIDFVNMDDSIEKISKIMSDGRVPLVSDAGKENEILAIITDIDLLKFLGRAR